MRKTTPRERALIRKLQRLEMIANDRWYISFNLTGSYNHKTGKYDRAAWPILFKTEEAAWVAVELLPIFANSDAMPNRGRIKSASVERVKRHA